MRIVSFIGWAGLVGIVLVSAPLIFMLLWAMPWWVSFLVVFVSIWMLVKHTMRNDRL